MIAQVELEPNARLRKSEPLFWLNREPRPVRGLEHPTRLARLIPSLPPQAPCKEGVDDCDKDVENGGYRGHRAVMLIEPREHLAPHATALQCNSGGFSKPAAPSTSKQRHD